MRTRRPIKRPQLTLRLLHARFDWSHDHLGWTIRTWRRVHLSDESRFLLRPKQPLPRPSRYEPVLSRRRFARSTYTWTVSNIPCLTKSMHQSYNDGMVIPEVVCHPSMAKRDGSTCLMKVVFCYALPTVVQGFGPNETLHFRTTTFWAHLLLGVGV
jgi:hypothetical protein